MDWGCAVSGQINIDELEQVAAQAAGPQLGGANFTTAQLKFRATFDPMTVLTLINQLRALGDRAMHLERRLSDANGEVLRLQGAQQHALRLQAGHDEAVMRAQVLERERDALAAQIKELEGQEPITVEWPTFPYESMVSGLEERGAVGDYEAMLYGWERGVKQVVDALPDSLFYARPVPAEHPTPATRPGWRDINDIVADREKDPSKAAALERARERLAAESAPAEPVNVEFGMRGKNMVFKIGNQSFLLDYKPDEEGEFELMRDMLLSAFSRITHGVKTASEPVNARLVEALRRVSSTLGAIGDLPSMKADVDSALSAAEAQQAEPVRLTDEEIEAVEEIQRKSSVPSFFLVNPVMFARRVEAAVLRKQGYKAEG